MPTLRPLRVLCIHGVGHAEVDPLLQRKWQTAIVDGVKRWNPGREAVLRFIRYDGLFAAASLSPQDFAEAIAKLAASGIRFTIEDALGPSRGIQHPDETLRWTAGMVAQWVENAGLRARARRRVLQATREFAPDVVCAHSLGSLIAYDTFARSRNADAIAGRTFVSFGSQIGNPFVRATFGGRLTGLPALRWFHLFNPRDRVFTSRIELDKPAFQQVETGFDGPGSLNHDAERYLAHPRTLQSVWRQVAGEPIEKSMARTEKVFRATVKKPRRRAFLVGINDYPDPQNRLDGCVNDVYLMSAALQECGFDPEDIRILLNGRATLAGMLDRLDWLLEGSGDGQDRVFFFSGHGARIPQYGRKDEVDHQDECLVGYDFDWSRERAFTDDRFHEYYSQLPYGTRFLAMFDCCHSGGMTRDGGLRARGLNPPDDIRHRALKWDPRALMWVPRQLPPINRAAASWKQKDFFGRDGQTRRLGSAALLRSLTDRTYDRACSDFGHRGPFLPVLLQACQEGELSYEYRHGVTSYGAFTYSIVQTLRAARRAGRSLTWERLTLGAGRALEHLDYDQTPALVCPERIRKSRIPWRGRG
ncbi:MAG TPA: caspase family protein [Patescibacteria group bacterium]|nr:caspase family protein [Patescibacteria group bacterium]